MLGCCLRCRRRVRGAEHARLYSCANQGWHLPGADSDVPTKVGTTGDRAASVPLCEVAAGQRVVAGGRVAGSSSRRCTSENSFSTGMPYGANRRRRPWRSNKPPAMWLMV